MNKLYLVRATLSTPEKQCYNVYIYLTVKEYCKIWIKNLNSV